MKDKFGEKLKEIRANIEASNKELEKVLEEIRANEETELPEPEFVSGDKVMRKSGSRGRGGAWGNRASTVFTVISYDPESGQLEISDGGTRLWDADLFDHVYVGPAEASNYGIYRALGTYVYFMDKHGRPAQRIICTTMEEARMKCIRLNIELRVANTND